MQAAAAKCGPEPVRPEPPTPPSYPDLKLDEAGAPRPKMTPEQYAIMKERVRYAVREEGKVEVTSSMWAFSGDELDGDGEARGRAVQGGRGAPGAGSLIGEPDARPACSAVRRPRPLRGGRGRGASVAGGAVGAGTRWMARVVARRSRAGAVARAAARGGRRGGVAAGRPGGALGRAAALGRGRGLAHSGDPGAARAEAGAAGDSLAPARGRTAHCAGTWTRLRPRRSSRSTPDSSPRRARGAGWSKAARSASARAAARSRRRWWSTPREPSAWCLPTASPACGGIARSGRRFSPIPSLLVEDGEIPRPLREAGLGVDLEHRDARLALGLDRGGQAADRDHPVRGLGRRALQSAVRPHHAGDGGADGRARLPAGDAARRRHLQPAAPQASRRRDASLARDPAGAARLVVLPVASR